MRDETHAAIQALRDRARACSVEAHSVGHYAAPSPREADLAATIIHLAATLDDALDVVDQAERVAEAVERDADPKRAAARYRALRYRLTDTRLGCVRMPSANRITLAPSSATLAPMCK